MPPASTHEIARSLNARLDQLGRGEAVQAGVGVVVAGERRADDQQPELAAASAAQAQSAVVAMATTQAELEGAPPAPGALVPADQAGEQRAAGDVGGDRQRRQPGVRRQAQADQAVDGDEGDVVGEEEALAQRQQQQPSVHSWRLRSARPSQASSASGAVSARSMRGPSETGTKPRAQRRPLPRRARARLPGRSARRAGAPGRRGSGRAAPPGGARHRARLSTQRGAAAAAAPSSRSQASKRSGTGDARHAGAPALLARRGRDRLPVARAAPRRARRPGAPPSARRPAAGSPRRRARSPSRPARPCARWPACRRPA